MASSLSRQLAGIAATSTKPLDLRAKRDAHSQSLLFEKKVAATQDFDTIYDYCMIGFQELCRLEPEYLTFSNTIFSEASKTRERGQLTAAENATLDTILDRFLTLSCKHLLLQPAQKAIEWLVRRFRVHEMNTESLVLTFLIYHPLPIFSTLLSILPKQLPRSLKFLHPYQQRLQPLPGDALQHAINTNSQFFDIWCGYIIKSCRWNHQHEPMLSYWTIRVSSAVEAQLEATKLGNARAQREKEENVVRQITNIIDKCLTFRQIPSMIIGCYIIIERLVLAANLSDAVILTFMDAIAKAATSQTYDEALAGLAVLAQQRKSLDISPVTFEFLLRLNDVVQRLEERSTTTKLDRLPAALAMEIIREYMTETSQGKTQILVRIMTSNLLDDRTLLMLLRRIFESQSHDSSNTLERFVLRAALPDDSSRLAKIMQTAASDPNIDKEFQSAIQSALRKVSAPEEVLAIHDDTAPSVPSKTVISWREFMPESTNPPLSYLAPEGDGIFHQLAAAFAHASEDSTTLVEFLAVDLLNTDQVTMSPTFISFFVRIWSSQAPSKQRAMAISCVNKALEGSSQIMIAQFLLPFILKALADSARTVRVAIATLTERLDSVISNALDAEQTEWNSQQFYGASGNLTLLTPAELSTIIQKVLLPHLEEFKMDSCSVQQSIRDCLLGSSSTVSGAKFEKLKKSSRSTLLQFLADHTTMVPILRVKLCLLNIVAGIHKAGHLPVFEAFQSFLESWALTEESHIQKACSDEKLQAAEFCLAVVKIVSPSSTTSNRKLQSLLSKISSQTLLLAVFDYTRESWSRMDSTTRTDWALSLFEFGVLNSKDSLFSELGRDCLSSLTLPTNVFELFLSDMNNSELGLDVGSPSAKRRKTADGTPIAAAGSSSEGILGYLARITALLDLIRSSGSSDRYILLPGLFKLFHNVQKSSSALQNDLNQVQWLFLTCLRELVMSTDRLELARIDSSEIRSDLVINTLTSTTDPETQYAALRLLSSLANLEPELIVHSMMPVFTFIGDNLLKQDNSHAAHVVNQIIDSVIPPLVASFRRQKGNTLAGVSGIISSFAAAFDHISSPQRLDLFAALIDKLGAADHLSILFVILQEQHSDQLAIKDFISSMFSRYSAAVQFKTIHNCLDMLSDSFEARPKLLKQIFAADAAQDPEKRLLSLASLPVELLQTPQLVPKISKALRNSNADAETIRSSYSEMVQQTLDLTLQQSKTPSVANLIDTIASTLTSSFPVSESLQALETVLQKGSEELLGKFLHTFRQAIERAQPGDKRSCMVCFGLVSSLSSVIETRSNSWVKQNAIQCINSIAKIYGKVDMQKSLEIAQFVAGSFCLQSAEVDVQIAALQALTTMIAVLHEEVLPICPTIMATSLEFLATILTEQEWNSRLHNAIYSMFGALFIFIPWIVTGEKLDRLLELSYISASISSETTCDEERITVLTLLAKNAEAQSLFVALAQNWGQAVNRGDDSVREHLQVLDLAVEKHAKPTVAANASTLIDHFTNIMALRTIVLQQDMQDWEETDVVEVEEAVSSILIKMIYKLNDAHFRPLFIRMSEWATASKGSDQLALNSRLSSWFAFLQQFFSTLQSIVVSYAAYIQDAAVDVLKNVSSQNPETHFLWSKTVLTLSATFEHDQDDFWKAPARFSEMCSPLIAQLEQATNDDDRDILIPCLTAFAVAVESAEHRAEIHKQILNHFRSDKPLVRRNIFTCQIALTEALGEEWITLFDSSATYPIMSEAFEDDHEEVENEVRKWKIQIEGITGESLDSRLQ